MDFVGTYAVTERENYEEFARAAGGTQEMIEKGRSILPKMVICKEDAADTFTVKRIFPNQTTTNTFTLGVETELNLVGDKKEKATITLDDGKLKVKGENMTQESELCGDKLKETLTVNGVTMVRWSKKE